MANLIDRRGNNKNRLAGSRRRFLERYKTTIRQRIDAHIKKGRLKTLNRDIDVDIKGTKEVSADYDRNRSAARRIHSGNKRYNAGDQIYNPKDRTGKGGAGNSGGLSEDDFQFILTKEEFLDILFQDMGLPNFLKKNNKLMTKTKFISGGYVKEGIPARLAIKKTLENSIARRIATRGSAVGKRFLDDIDLRYRNMIPEHQPVAEAVIFMVLDISGSMDEIRKLMAKKFFLFLYLFLTKHYTNVTIRFIPHTTEAWESGEYEFFYSDKSGGTMVSPAFGLVNHIIDTEYDCELVNIYVAQASDGDNWGADYPNLEVEICDLLPKIQYMAYVEIDSNTNYRQDSLSTFYRHEFPNSKLATADMYNEGEVLDVLRGLFKS